MEDFGHYDNEQLMAAIFIETFGSDTMKEAYYSSDIENVLANKIISASGKDDNTIEEVYTLLDETQEVLYRSGELGENFREDAELMKKYEALYKKISYFYEKVNERPISDNSIITAIQDCVLDLNNSRILNSGEKIQSIKYDENRNLNINIVSNHNEPLEYTSGIGQSQIPDPKYFRTISINQKGKFEDPGKYANITDKDIEYLSR